MKQPDNTWKVTIEWSSDVDHERCYPIYLSRVHENLGLATYFALSHSGISNLGRSIEYLLFLSRIVKELEEQGYPEVEGAVSKIEAFNEGVEFLQKALQQFEQCFPQLNEIDIVF